MSRSEPQIDPDLYDEKSAGSRPRGRPRLEDDDPNEPLGRSWRRRVRCEIAYEMAMSFEVSRARHEMTDSPDDPPAAPNLPEIARWLEGRDLDESASFDYRRDVRRAERAVAAGQRSSHRRLIDRIDGLA